MRANLETANDPHPLEQDIAITVGGSIFRFVLIVPRYVAGMLTPEDWTAAGEQLRAERDRHVRRSILTGMYFTEPGQAQLRENIRKSMCDLIYERFVQRQMAAGNESWAVPETLQRA